MPRERTLHAITNAAVFIILEVAALSMLAGRNDLQHIWIAKASHRFMAWAWGGSESVRHYFSLKKENEELAMENFLLREQLAAYVSRESRDRADSLTGELRRRDDWEYHPASIVKISRNKAHNYFIIDKGSEDGIRPRSGVITSSGVVGVIDAVDRHYSYGLSFLNSDLGISSRIGREGPVGRLSWNGISPRKAVLKDIPLQNKFAPGDTVWTSGYSSIFPPDIAIGTVEGSRVAGGAVYEVSVELSQDFSAVRYVTVVDNAAVSEIRFLENLESEEGK